MSTVYEIIASSVEKMIAAAKEKRDALPWYAFIARAGFNDVIIPDMESHLRGLKFEFEFEKMYPGSSQAVLSQEFDPKEHGMMVSALLLPNDS